MTLPRKALALVSGGLDSMLAVRTLQEQGIVVEGVNFYTGFCVEGHTHAIRKRPQDKQKRNNALWVAERLGIKLHIEDISEEYKNIVLKPKYGYGANLNPCLDCKVFMVGKANAMLNRARQLASDGGFDFIITGEVVGQRPKSQRKFTLPLIARESGADDRLLRPLCAKLMEPTLPEREGWVDRNRLFGFHGRSRSPQIALAKQYGFEDYAQPAGGCCFLTDESYTRKLRDLWSSRGVRDYDLDDILLLKLGRHLRPAPHYKLMIGREEGENNFMEGYRKRFYALRILGHQGALCLVDGSPGRDDLRLCAAIAARFSQGRDASEVSVQIEPPEGGTAWVETVKPMLADDIPGEWHV